MIFLLSFLALHAIDPYMTIKNNNKDHQYQVQLLLTLADKLQEGIFYDKMREFKSYGNYSYAILFLKIRKGFDNEHIVNALKKIWKMYELLKKGRISDIDRCTVPAGELSVLIGYTPEVFTIPGIRKRIPKDFARMQFLPSLKGKPLLDGCGINYSQQTCQKVGESNHIAIQFISATQLASHRAIVETWRHLNATTKDDRCLQITKFFMGFQRDDGRSWLGFHDEVSNMKDKKEREDCIVIDRTSNQLMPEDFWTEGGTYMAYLRTDIDLEAWDRVGRIDQELIIGRDKTTGSPIIGVNREGKPIRVDGHYEAEPAQFYEGTYHEHPDYLKPSKLNNTEDIDIGKSRNLLIQSHIGRARHISNISSKDPTSRRIYRQGFEFIEPQSNGRKPFRLGLNFISFQNDPRRLFFILIDPRWMGKSNFGGPNNLINNRFLSVRFSGLYFVPPRQKPFPGYSLFH
jgi:deferrochelatase/peroxidase EfeB